MYRLIHVMKWLIKKKRVPNKCCVKSFLHSIHYPLSEKTTHPVAGCFATAVPWVVG